METITITIINVSPLGHGRDTDVYESKVNQKCCWDIVVSMIIMRVNDCSFD